MDNLPERLRRVVVGYFFEELPMQVLAEELGVTDSRISTDASRSPGAPARRPSTLSLDPDLVHAEAVRAGGQAPVRRRRAEAAHTTTAGASTPLAGQLSRLAKLYYSPPSPNRPLNWLDQLNWGRAAAMREQ